MACHACHRIFVRFESCYTCGSVYLRIVCHHALIHAVESKIFSFRTPECTFVNTEFITVYSLSVNDVVNIVATTCGFLNVDVRINQPVSNLLGSYMQIVAHCICHSHAFLAEINICSSLVYFDNRFDSLIFKVIDYDVTVVREKYFFFLSPWH